MNRSWRAVIMACSVLVPAGAQAETIPLPIEKMIKAAAATGDATKLSTTVELAKQTTPESASEIDALVAQLNKSAEEVRVAKLQSQGVFEGWKGQGEAGASASTGNAETTGIAVGLALAKENLRWRHAVTGSVDYVRNQGETQKERYFAGYEGNFKFSDRLYVLGLFSWEKDRFAGFSRRFSEAIGIGYSPIKTPTMSLNLEAGPALRQTNFIDGQTENMVSGRGALDYRWVIRPGLIFTEKASAYLESDNSTLLSTTAVDVKLIGALSGRASFLVQHETDPPIGLKNTNTTSRLTLVYAF